MGILGWILLTILALVVLGSFLPLRLDLALRKQEIWTYSAALRPFAGIGPRILLAGSHKQRNSRHRGAEPKKRASVVKRGKAGHIWQGEPFGVMREATRFLLCLLRRIRVDRARIDLTFGLGDPAETGQAFGLLAPIIYGTCAERRMQVRVEPEFDKAVLRGCADLSVSLIPAFLLPPLIRFGWYVFGPVR